jgi:phosphatidylinositol alpha-1,6-mannosyltransferase
LRKVSAHRVGSAARIFTVTQRFVPLLVTFDFPPLQGGIQRYAARLSGELCALGYAAQVVAPHVPGDAAADAVASAPVRRFHGRGGVGRTAGAMFELARTAGGSSDPRTIALSWLPGLAAAALPRRVRGGLTLLAHGTELDVPPGSPRDHAMRFVFRRADRVVANSRAVAQRISALGLARDVAVVFPGVDPHPLTRRPAREPTVLFVGRLVERKGADRLIDAIALLRDRNVSLHVIGDGPQYGALVARARDAGIAERIRFSGAVDDLARDDALAQAWCLAMPARRERGDIEGFGIVYLEAAMAGLPAIGGRDCGAEDAIEDGVTGLLVDGNDATAIAGAIATLVDDRARAHAMGMAGRERALRSFTWRHNADQIVRLAGLCAS